MVRRDYTVRQFLSSLVPSFGDPEMYDYSRRIRTSHPSRTSSIRRPFRQYTCQNDLVPLPSNTGEHSNSTSRSVVSFIDLYVLAANLFVQRAQCRRPTRIAISNLAAGGEGVSFPAIARFFYKVGLEHLSLHDALPIYFKEKTRNRREGNTFPSRSKVTNGYTSGPSTLCKIGRAHV